MVLEPIFLHSSSAFCVVSRSALFVLLSNRLSCVGTSGGGSSKEVRRRHLDRILAVRVGEAPLWAVAKKPATYIACSARAVSAT